MRLRNWFFLVLLGHILASENVIILGTFTWRLRRCSRFNLRENLCTSRILQRDFLGWCRHDRLCISNLVFDIQLVRGWRHIEDIFSLVLSDWHRPGCHSFHSDMLFFGHFATSRWWLYVSLSRLKFFLKLLVIVVYKESWLAGWRQVVLADVLLTWLLVLVSVEWYLGLLQIIWRKFNILDRLLTGRDTHFFQFRKILKAWVWLTLEYFNVG